MDRYDRDAFVGDFFADACAAARFENGLRPSSRGAAVERAHQQRHEIRDGVRLEHDLVHAGLDRDGIARCERLLRGASAKRGGIDVGPLARAGGRVARAGAVRCARGARERDVGARVIREESLRRRDAVRRAVACRGSRRRTATRVDRHRAARCARGRDERLHRGRARGWAEIRGRRVDRGHVCVLLRPELRQ